MTVIQKFEITVSEWPGENGESYYTITDGVDEKGQFATRVEAEANLESTILSWRCDS